MVDLTERWGYEVAPGELGVVPFHLAVLADQLQQLALQDRPPVLHHVGRHLAALLLRVRDADTARQLRTLASAAGEPVEIDGGVAARMVRPLRVLLDAVSDGLKLTAAGYLPPKVVSTIFDELDLADVWIGKGNREDLTLRVLELREAAQQLGLLRKYKGRLVPTSRGRALADNPVGLWRHAAGRLPMRGREVSDAGWQAGVLVLALVATGATEDLDSRIAALLTGLGWAVGDRQPIDRHTATGLIAADVRLLQRLGALDGELLGAWPGTATPGGIQLARAALADPADVTQQ